MTPTDCLEAADSEAAARAAMQILLEQAAASISARGRFVLALCGGRTPERLYRRLAEADEDWDRWHLVYGDERCLPCHHEDRNSTLVTRCWLDAIDFPSENHHVPEVELGSDVAAARYAAAIETLLPLDMALLGIGEDGHTASLFPGHTHPFHSVVPVHDAPKPPAQRISLSYATLCDAAAVCFLVTGAAKHDALRRCLQGDDLPAARIRGKTRTTLVTDFPVDNVARR
ncbi:MAG: 6-phosphogluconolactonase [Halioglobus sp.]|nr:6-phosphogluconolactonase [Halioglobus sp.]